MGVRILATRGTESQIQSVSSASQSEGQIAYATDTKDFYVSDGAQFNKIGKDQLSQFSEISIVTDVNTWTINQDNGLDLNPPEANPTGITFKPDGTKVFTIGYSLNRVQMYDLSTAWDLTSAGSPTQSEYLVQNNLGSVQEDFFIDSSGTRMYVISRSSDSVSQFTLNTAWDISDITFVQDLHINSTSLSGGVTGVVTGEPDPAGITFKPDGTILYIVGYNQDKVHQIPLSTAWDISTHGTITEFNIFPANVSQAIQFSSDGTDMYIGDYSTESIVHFTLSTAWDVTTATFVSRGIPFLESFNLPTSTGFYFNDVAGKAFVCGRSGDYAYEVVITDAIKFDKPVSVPMLYGDTIHAGSIITSNTGLNYFYSALYARSTFVSLTTTYLGDSSSTPNIRFGNTVYGGGQVNVYRNVYTGNLGGNVPEFRIMQPRIGGRGIVKIGKEYETTPYLEGGVVDIESEASTFDHLGEFTLGGELKVGGTKPLAYKDPNLYTLGTQIVLDNFNETVDTDITSHTPDTGSGYTQVYASNGVTDDDIPFIPANGGYLKAERSNSNDGRRYVNDTTISTNNYEVRAVIKQQVNSDDPFSIVVKYIDENNYFVMHFAANYNYCYPYSVINGVATQHGALYYYANTSTADNLGLEVAVRVVGNQVSVFYEGQYRGSKEINITGAGKAGFGFGRTSDLYGTSFDLHTNISISKFEVYELPDSLFDGSDSVHYIENGGLGIGTTSIGTAKVVIDHTNTKMLELKRNGATKARFIADSNNGQLDLYDSSTVNSVRLLSSGVSYLNGGNVGIGTSAPTSTLHVAGTARIHSVANGAFGTLTLGSINDIVGDVSYIDFKNNGSSWMRINNGNVGIGTTSPARLLHVDGSSGARISYESANMDLFYYGIEFNRQSNYLRPTTNSGKSLYIGSGSQNYTWGTVYLDAAVVQFRNSSSEPLMRFESSTGRLGIGTTSPSSPLTVAGRVDFQNDLRLRGTDSASNQGVTRFFVDSSNRFHIDTANDGNNNFVIDSVGKVGIGTTNPYATLTVAGNITQTDNSYLISTRKITARGAEGLALYNNGGQGIDIKDNNNVIVTSGNVGIGTTSPSEKLHVGGDIRVDSDEIYITQSSSSRKPVRLHQNAYKGAITLQRDGVDKVNISSDATYQGHTYFDGDSVNVGIGTTSPTEKLHVNGNLRFMGSRFIGTTAATDDLDIIPERDLNLGTQASDNVYIGRASAWGGSVVIQASAANTMVVHDNKVGIGTTSPQAKLDVEGLVIARNNGFQLRGTSPSTTAYTSIEQNGTEGVFRLYNGSNWGFIARGVGNTPYIGAYQNGSLRIRGFGASNGSDNVADKDLAIFDFANERVGIGTQSPTEKLHVVGKGVFESVDIFKTDTTANPRLRVGRYDAETLNFDVDDLVARIYHKQDETGSSVHKLNLTVDSDSTAGSEINLGFRNNDGSNESTKLAILSTGNVGIGTTSPDASAILDIASTSKGVVFPRMTSAQRTAISSPTTGLIVYQTDATEGLYIYKSTGWTQII